MKEEYHTTQFVTGPIEGKIPEFFFIVTAHNPFGSLATDEENTANNERLQTKIRNSAWTSFPVTGRCKDHAEAGFGIACTRAEALRLGRQFQQDAIYEVHDDKVILIDCKEEEPDERVGQWSKLQAPIS